MPECTSPSHIIFGFIPTPNFTLFLQNLPTLLHVSCSKAHSSRGRGHLDLDRHFQARIQANPPASPCLPWPPSLVDPSCSQSCFFAPPLSLDGQPFGLFFLSNRFHFGLRFLTLSFLFHLVNSSLNLRILLLLSLDGGIDFSCLNSLLLFQCFGFLFPFFLPVFFV